MAEQVSRERIEREPGYLYYLSEDGYLWRTPTRLNNTGTKKRVGTERVLREDGYFYFLDKRGYVSRAAMKPLSPSVTRSPGATAIRPPIVVHTIERQVVKVRCRHCGKLGNEVDGKCPSCGAPL